MTDPELAVQLLTEDRAALLMTQPFLALLALRLEITPCDAMATMGTDGQRLLANPAFVVSLDPVERSFLVAHVIWHGALQHPWRRGARDPCVWDAAIDHEVNCLLEPYWTLPPGTPHFATVAGASAETAYDWLLTQPPTLLHRPARADHHGDAFEQASRDHILQRRWTEHVFAAAQQLGRRGYSVPAAVRRLIEGWRTGTVPWRDLLRRYVVRVLGDRRQWLPPNRRYVQRGLYLPSRREQHLRVAVGLDTSASTQPLRASLLGEVVGIVASATKYELTLLQVDHRLRRVQTYTQERRLDASRFETIGEGGTNLELVFEAVQNRLLHPDVLVFLTDGRGTAPRHPPPYPVIWALPRGATAPTHWGQTVTILESVDGPFHRA